MLLFGCRTQERAGAEPRGSFRTRDLSVDEARGGHILKRHVAQSDEQLRQRLEREPNIPAASTYADRGTAERVIGAALDANADKINQWLKRGSRRPNLVLDYTEPNNSLGRVMFRGAGGSVPCDHAVVVLRADGPKDYYALTSYPECKP
jgi:Bacterial CdiA-CT RNAse A domain